MHVAHVESRGQAGQRELAAEVRFARGAPARIFFRWPDAGALPAAGDPFLAALLVPAMALHEDLVIDAPVSRDLLEAGRERIAPVISRFHPDFGSAEIRVAEEVEAERVGTPPEGVAALYSGGLDSRFTLFRNRERLTHLAFVHGFDLALDDLGEREKASRRFRAMAGRQGLEAVEIVSNVRDVMIGEVRARLRELGRPMPRFMPYANLGSVLASLGLVLGRHAGRVLVAASWPAGAGPTGSHPEIEPAWSTPRLAFELDGVESHRVAKAAWLAREHPAEVRDLHACVGRPRRADNCGRCWKCIRLRLELRVAGVAPGDMPFDAPLSQAAVRCMWLPLDPYLAPGLLEAARARGDEETARTVEILLDRRFHLPRELARLRDRTSAEGRRALRRYRRYSKLPPGATAAGVD